ncbi:MAG: DNA mismatch repair protein MutS [Candidatus Cloacimonetes bacterium]|nr:DNA mismatch repair protein MutS [Candidatus Cloacimonadota bacterium]
MQADTPLMQQFFEFKAQHPDALLFLRCGDFYELFHEDAKTAAKELQITLTSRNKTSENPVPMAGVPYHAYEDYAAKLIAKGYKIAICEQIEDPKLAKGIVKRAVTRVITPGTVSLEGVLKPDSNNYLACITQQKNRFCLCWADVTTGEAQVFLDQTLPGVLDFLLLINPSELLIPKEILESVEYLPLLEPVLCSSIRVQPVHYKVSRDFPLLQSGEILSEPVWNSSGLNLLSPARYCLETLLVYIKELGIAVRICSLKETRLGQFLNLDQSTFKSLEILPSNSSEKDGISLFSVLNKTVSAAGARLLRQFLLYPLRNPDEINERLSIVEVLCKEVLSHQKLREALRSTYDLYRISSRLLNQSVSPRDLVCLKNSLSQIPLILAELNGIQGVHWLKNRPDPGLLIQKIEETLVDEPSLKTSEGNFIRPGFSPILDESRQLRDEADTVLAELEAREKQNSGLKGLKLKFNRVFGYYLELPSAQATQVPDHFIRKQTLSNAERFTTTELKSKEQAIFEASFRCQSIELELLAELRQFVLNNLETIQTWAENFAFLDVMQSFALQARENRYCRPEFTEETIFHIHEGRHPVVETVVDNFVANDLMLERNQDRVLLITGPNMGGKSTYLRQAALMALMAQAGSFVPASRFCMKPLDRIFTRIGASDNLSAGKSTFMMEMSETASLLRQATPDSLILLDEVGRGTSTFDGLSLAWAILSHIVKEIGCLSLFATHYHELTQITGLHPEVRNLCVSVHEEKGQVVFLHKIKRGSADRSYGIHVARLAGVPEPVLKHAQKVLLELEATKTSVIGLDTESKRLVVKGKQKTLFQADSVKPSPLIQRVLDLNPDKMTPVEALHALYALKDFAHAELKRLENEDHNR